MKLSQIVITASFLLLAACQKKDNTTPDPGNVVMTISSPSDGQSFKNGDTVQINASISYPSELHGYEVRITDTASGMIVYDNTQHVHTDHFEINDQWVCSAAQPGTLKLTIITHIDHNGEDARKELLLHTHP